MNLRTPASVAAVVLLAGAAYGLWRQQLELTRWRERALHAESEAKAETVRRVAFEQDVAAIQAKLAAASANNAEPAASTREKRAAKADAKKRSAAADFTGDSGLVTVEQLKQWLADANDPAVLRRLNNEQRAWAARRYKDLFTTLGLSPEDTEKVTQLLASKRQSGMDVAIASLQQGNDPTQDLEGFRQQVIAQHEKIEEELHAQLGDAGYAQYQNFDQNSRYVSMLANIQTSLRATTEPLTADQSEQLMRVFQTNNARRVTDEVLAQAGTFLSESQMRALHDLQAVQLANMQKRLQTAAQAGQALPTTPASPPPK